MVIIIFLRMIKYVTSFACTKFINRFICPRDEKKVVKTDYVLCMLSTCIALVKPKKLSRKINMVSIFKMVTKDFENFILNHQIFVIKNGLDILKISIIVARCNIVTKLVG